MTATEDKMVQELRVFPLALGLWVVFASAGCGGDSSGSDGGTGVDAGCMPSASETRLTAACGTETHNCGVDRTWGPWVQPAPDPGDPEGLLGEAQFADRVVCEGSAVRYFRCGSACTWETTPTECGGGCDGTRRVSPPLEEEICVPGGAVEIGCETEGEDCYPRHSVYLTPYYIDRYPVVVGRYLECVEAGACTPLTTFVGRQSELYNDVVEGFPGAQIRTATHGQAVAFCAWDGAELVSGAQWERAAIGINTDRVFFPWDRPEPESLEYCVRINSRNCYCPSCGVTWFPTADIQTYTLSASSINVSVMWNYYEWTSDVILPYPTDGMVVVNPRYEQTADALPYEHRGWEVRWVLNASAEDIAGRDQTHYDGYPARGSFRCSRAAAGTINGGNRD